MRRRARRRIPGRPPGRGRQLLAAAVSAAFTLLAVEAALRLAGDAAAGRGSPWYAGGSHPRFLFRPDPALGYSLRPGFAGEEVAASGEFAVAVAIDASGRRQHPHEVPGGPPILALGDSMTYGEGVPVERAWPAVLERAAGLPVENAGVPGYNSRQMVAAGARRTAASAPRLALVTVAAGWDIDRCTSPFVYRDGYIVASGYRDRLELVDGNLWAWQVRHPRLGPATARLMARSHLARLALPAARRLARGELGGGEGAPPLPSVGGWSPCLDALARFADGERAAGRDALVVLADSSRPRDREATERVLAALAARGVPHVALDRLLARAGSEELRFPVDRHWNERGHAAVGEALARLLGPRLAALSGAAADSRPPAADGAPR